MDGAVPISPELALVDPTLRVDAVRALPWLEPDSFLPRPLPRHVVEPIEPVAGPLRASAPAPPRRRAPILVAAVAYVAFAAFRFCVSAAVLVAAVALAAALIAAVG